MVELDKKIPILVVEDNLHDFEVLERAFMKAEIGVPLHRCNDGEEALMLLYGEHKGEYPKNLLPSLILLDLNMPGMDGHALLESVKDDDKLKHIPIIVLTSSANEQDVILSYKNGANSYIQKPSNINDYVDMVKDIEHYWYARSIIPAQLSAV